MFKSLLKPGVLVGTGCMVMFGAAVYEYSNKYSNDTGFHIRDTDPQLRKVEKDVLIPKIMRDRARTMDCADRVKDFNDCCTQYKTGSLQSYMTFVSCKKVNDAMWACMNDKFTDMEFYEECKKIYLNEKKIFQLTNVLKKERTKIKAAVESGKPPNFSMNESMQKYFESVSENFQQSSDIDGFDNILLGK